MVRKELHPGLPRPAAARAWCSWRPSSSSWSSATPSRPTCATSRPSSWTTTTRRPRAIWCERSPPRATSASWGARTGPATWSRPWTTAAPSSGVEIPRGFAARPGAARAPGAGAVRRHQLEHRDRGAAATPSASCTAYAPARGRRSARTAPPVDLRERAWFNPDLREPQLQRARGGGRAHAHPEPAADLAGRGARARDRARSSSSW